MPNVESYEVQGTPYEQTADKTAMINQITEDMISDHAGYGFKVKFHNGNQMTVTYHCFEIDLPSRIKEVDAQAETYLKEYEKRLKADFKSRTRSALKLKERKAERCGSVEKVSLNNRYYYRSSRTYEL